MTKIYKSREGEATALDTKTQLTTLGSETAPGPLLVPAGAKQISRILVATMGNMAAATSCMNLIRIEGPGLSSGPEVFAAKCFGQGVATGGNASDPAEEIVVNIPVVPGNEILIFAEMSGTDIGQVSAAVTLCFDK